MNRDAMVSQLIIDEAMKLKPYTDTKGKLTIGIGRNLTDVGISEPEARTLLSNDLDVTEKSLDHALPMWRQLSEARQEVILNMSFNMGVEKLLEFKNMLHDIQAGDFIGAAREMLASAWSRQVGKRADRLAEQMRNG